MSGSSSFAKLCSLPPSKASNQKQSHINNNSNSNSNTNTNKNNESKSIEFNHAKLNARIPNIIHGCKAQGGKQYQEDSFCAWHSPDLTVLVGGVFDGHGGLNGQIASQAVERLCHQYFSRHWLECKTWDRSQWTTRMGQMFEGLHHEVRQQFVALEKQRRITASLPLEKILDVKIIRKPSGFPIHGGTTCTIVVVLRDTTSSSWRIITANAGDSDSLLLARRPTRLAQNNKCEHLSIDHSPDNSDEYARVQQLDDAEYPRKLLFVYDQANIARKYECPGVFLSDGSKDPKYVKNPWGNHLRPTNVRYDPAVYAVTPYGVAHDITCIAMTRSIGDFYAHQFGLSYEPSVTFKTLDLSNEYIVVVGSDGIWDCWKWDDFSDYVNGLMTEKKGQLSVVCEEVLRQTVKRAKACFGDSSYDDASLICMSLKSELFEEQELKGLQKQQSKIDSLSAVASIVSSQSTMSSTSASCSNTENISSAYSKGDSQEDVFGLDETTVRGLDEDED